MSQSILSNLLKSENKFNFTNIHSFEFSKFLAILEAKVAYKLLIVPMLKGRTNFEITTKLHASTELPFTTAISDELCLPKTSVSILDITSHEGTAVISSDKSIVISESVNSFASEKYETLCIKPTSTYVFTASSTNKPKLFSESSGTFTCHENKICEVVLIWPSSPFVIAFESESMIKRAYLMDYNNKGNNVILKTFTNPTSFEYAVEASKMLRESTLEHDLNYGYSLKVIGEERSSNTFTFKLSLRRTEKKYRAIKFNHPELFALKNGSKHKFVIPLQKMKLKSIEIQAISVLGDISLVDYDKNKESKKVTSCRKGLLSYGGIDHSGKN